MGTGVTEQKQREASADGREALPDLKPWREVGWIFRDGGCIAIERRGDLIEAYLIEQARASRPASMNGPTESSSNLGRGATAPNSRAEASARGTPGQRGAPWC